MKRIVVICMMLIVPGLSSFGETNTVPPKAHSPASPEQQAKKAVPKPATAPAPAGNTVSHSQEIQPAQLPAWRRVEQERLLAVQNNKRDMGAMLEGLFHAPNNETIVIIFPTGK